MPHTPTRTASTSATAIGWVATETQRGQIITGSRSTSARIVSNAALPAPTIIAARSVVTGTGPAFRIAAVSALLRRCGERSSAPRRVRRGTRSVARLPPLRPLRPPSQPHDRASRSRRCRESARGGRRPRHRRAHGASQRCRSHLRRATRPHRRSLRRSSRHTDDLVLHRERPHERAADRAGRSDDGNPHSDAPHGRPAPGTAWRPDRAGQLEPPERAAQQWSETFDLDRGVDAVGPPGDRPARPACDQPAEDRAAPAERAGRNARRPARHRPGGRRLPRIVPGRASPDESLPSTTARAALPSSATPTGARCAVSIVPSSCLTLTLSMREDATGRLGTQRSTATSAGYRAVASGDRFAVHAELEAGGVGRERQVDLVRLQVARDRGREPARVSRRQLDLEVTVRGREEILGCGTDELDVVPGRRRDPRMRMRGVVPQHAPTQARRGQPPSSASVAVPWSV